MDPAAVEAAFEQVRAERFLRSHLDEARNPPGDPGYRRWGALAAHRDALGPDPAVVAGRLPAFLNIWIPLTTVTPLDSCLYVVPANRDADYRSNEPAARQERIRLQDVRAVPADAGSVIGWSTHLVHWGSASSRFAVGPRVSATMNLQRRDVPPFHSFTIDFNRRVPFDDRLAWIDDSMGAEAGLLQRTP